MPNRVIWPSLAIRQQRVFAGSKHGLSIFCQAVVIYVLLLSSALAVENGSQVLGAASGEELVFAIDWLTMPAGTGKLSFEYHSPAAAYYIQAQVASIDQIKAIYEINDILEARGPVKQERMSTYTYRKHEMARKDHRVSEHCYDREGQRVNRRVGGVDKGWIAGVGEEVNDLLTTFYLSRQTMENKSGATRQYQLLEKKKLYRLHVLAGEQLNLTTLLGTYLARPYMVSVTAPDQTVDKNMVTFWLTEDNRRLPLRIVIQSALGEIIANLSQYNDGRGESRLAKNSRLRQKKE